MRIGMGYDVHRLTENREMILGGVKIPYEKGLLGHSDADVLLHAVMDALLGAAALGDIGRHFPDTDSKYKGISSLELLRHVGGLIEEQLYVIGNIDATIIAQRRRISSRCGGILQRRFIWTSARSMSRRRRRKVLDSRGAVKGFRHRPSSVWTGSRIAVMRLEQTRADVRDAKDVLTANSEA